MSLPACEQRALDTMDKALAASEPAMAAMFAMFTGLSRSEGSVAAERLPPRHRARWQPGTLQLLIPGLFLMAILATLVVGLTASLRSSCAAAASLGPRAAAACGTRAPYPAGAGNANVPGHRPRDLPISGPKRG